MPRHEGRADFLSTSGRRYLHARAFETSRCSLCSSQHQRFSTTRNRLPISRHSRGTEAALVFLIHRYRCNSRDILIRDNPEECRIREGSSREMLLRVCNFGNFISSSTRHSNANYSRSFLYLNYCTPDVYLSIKLAFASALRE